jgi:hypothetical protein
VARISAYIEHGADIADLGTGRRRHETAPPMRNGKHGFALLQPQAAAAQVVLDDEGRGGFELDAGAVAQCPFAALTNGPVVIQFGPFAEDVAPRELAAALFEEMPLVVLSAQPAKLDDDAVLILGNRACQAPRPANE